MAQSGNAGNVTRLLGVSFTEGGVPQWIVTPRARTSLDGLVPLHPLSRHQLWAIIRDVLTGMTAVHSIPGGSTRVTPSSILITDGDRPGAFTAFVSDFGLSEAVAPPAPIYRAQGLNPGRDADVYIIGITIAELVCRLIAPIVPVPLDIYRTAPELIDAAVERLTPVWPSLIPVLRDCVSARPPAAAALLAHWPSVEPPAVTCVNCARPFAPHRLALILSCDHRMCLDCQGSARCGVRECATPVTFPHMDKYLTDEAVRVQVPLVAAPQPLAAVPQVRLYTVRVYLFAVTIDFTHYPLTTAGCGSGCCSCSSGYP